MAIFKRNDLGEFETVIDRITFVCDETEEGFGELAEELAAAYKQKNDAICAFLIEEGIEDVFGEIPQDKLMKLLGRPIISLDRSTVTYPDHSLDDDSIIEFEFEGMMESFMYLSIDG